MSKVTKQRGSASVRNEIEKQFINDANIGNIINVMYNIPLITSLEILNAALLSQHVNEDNDVKRLINMRINSLSK